MTVQPSQSSGTEALYAALANRGIGKGDIGKGGIDTVAKFGAAIDTVNQGGTDTIRDVRQVAAGLVDVKGVENLHDNSGNALAGFSGESDIKLDKSLNGDAQTLQSVAIEELGEAAFQAIFGDHSVGDFGAEVAARTDGSYDSLSPQEKDALKSPAEGDSVTVNGEAGEASPNGGGSIYTSGTGSFSYDVGPFAFTGGVNTEGVTWRGFGANDGNKVYIDGTGGDDTIDIKGGIRPSDEFSGEKTNVHGHDGNDTIIFNKKDHSTYYNGGAGNDYLVASDTNYSPNKRIEIQGEGGNDTFEPKRSINDFVALKDPGGGLVLFLDKAAAKRGDLIAGTYRVHDDVETYKFNEGSYNLNQVLKKIGV